MKPTKLFQAAGILIEPPVSEPIPPEHRLSAVATAAPEDEPPGANEFLEEFGGVAVLGLTPRPEKANSDRCVFPMFIKPAFLAFLTIMAFSDAIRPASS